MLIRRYFTAKNKSNSNTLNNRGFTIVELLIVVVVIAILATITIVAYRGIQNKAHNSRVVAMVQQSIKAFEQYKVVNNTYPGGEGQLTSYCLGSGYKNGKCGKQMISGQECPLNGTVIDITESSNINAALRSFLNSTLPAIEQPSFTISYTDTYVPKCTVTVTVSGPNVSILCYKIVDSSGNTTSTSYGDCGSDTNLAFSIQYFLRGENTNCVIANSRIDTSSISIPGWTNCTVFTGNVKYQP